MSLVSNGQPNRIVFHLTQPPSQDRVLSLLSISGAFLNPAKSDGQRGRVLRNMTTTTFKTEKKFKTLSGKPLEVPFDFYPEFKPQDLGVEFRLVVRDGQTSKKHNVLAYTGKVTVIEPPKSWFDLQTLSLYVFGLALLAGGAWLAREMYFPEPKKGKGRKKSGSTRTSAGPPTGATTGVAMGGNGKGYDESWIPESHLRSKKAVAGGSGDEGRKSPVGAGKKRR